MHRAGERRGAVARAEEFTCVLLHSELSGEGEAVGKGNVIRSVLAAAVLGNEKMRLRARRQGLQEPPVKEIFSSTFHYGFKSFWLLRLFLNPHAQDPPFQLSEEMIYLFCDQVFESKHDSQLF